jgi:hypothetical protein
MNLSHLLAAQTYCPKGRMHLQPFISLMVTQLMCEFPLACRALDSQTTMELDRMADWWESNSVSPLGWHYFI